MHKIFLLVIMMVFSIVTLAQVEIEHDVPYQSGEHLKMSSYGVSFIVPEGWAGVWLRGSSAFMLGRIDKSATVFLTVDASVNINPSHDLSLSIPLQQGIELFPKQTPSIEEGIWSNEFEVSGTDKPLEGSVQILPGDNGNTIVVIMLIEPGAYEEASNDIVKLLKTAHFTTPSSSSISSSTEEREWATYLRGRALKHYHMRGGRSMTESLFLCSDGTFVRALVNSDNVQEYTGEGKWEATGSGSSGKMVLQFSDSSQVSFEIHYGEGDKGSGLYLNGSRFYVGGNDKCR